MARILSQINYYKNINLSTDYSNVCDNISLTTLANYLVYSDSGISVVTHDLKGGSFEIKRNINQLSYINYIAIINNSNDRSPIFAFIENLEFVAEEVTRVHFIIDLFTTYCQTLDYQDCFIKRMTVSDDTPYKYLEAENLGTSDYVTDPNSVKREFVTSWKYGYTSVTNSSGESVAPEIKNNVLSMAKFHGGSDYNELMMALYLFNRNGYIDNVVDVFQYPSTCGDNGDKVSYEGYSVFPYKVDNYVPKNAKLLNYPYVRGLIVSTSGEVLEIKPEKALDSQRVPNISYHIDLIVQPINQMVLTLTDYDRLSYNDDKINRLVLTGFPQVIWASDNYKAWLARNKPSKELANEEILANVAGSVAGLAIGAMTGGVGLAVAGSTAVGLGINSYMAKERMQTQEETAKIQSKTVHRGGDLGVDVANNKFGFVIMIQSINAREASLIDNYFNAFGYAINKVTYFSPSRSRFDYVETAGELFRRKAEGAGVPNIAIDTINSKANSGLRIWHSIEELNRGNLVDANPII